jgi:ketosteroid isomerase-like protein
MLKLPKDTDTLERKKKFWLICVLLGLLVSCKPNDPELDFKAVKALIMKVQDGQNRGNWAEVVFEFTDEAALFPPDRLPLTGKDSIRLYYQRLLAGTDLEIEYKSEETRMMGPWAYNRGSIDGSKASMGDSLGLPFTGSYIMVMDKNPEGNWKVSRLMWTNVP